MSSMFRIDARVPVRFGAADTIQPGEALLVETGVIAPGAAAAASFDAPVADHAPGCACCLPRSPAAQALSTLFARRARGEVAFFDRVLVVAASETGRAAIRDAIARDTLAAGRFRLAPDAPADQAGL